MISRRRGPGQLSNYGVWALVILVCLVLMILLKSARLRCDHKNKTCDFDCLEILKLFAGRALSGALKLFAGPFFRKLLAGRAVSLKLLACPFLSFEVLCRACPFLGL